MTPTCTLHSYKSIFGCIRLYLDDTLIIGCLASTRVQAVMGLQCLIKGTEYQGPGVPPLTEVFDQEGLNSLTIEQLDQATYVINEESL